MNLTVETTEQSENGEEMVTTSQIISEMVKKYNEIPKKYVEGICSDLLYMIADRLENKQSVRLNQIGIMKVKMKAARKGRNPKDGTILTIPSRYGVHFKMSSRLKKNLSGE